MAVGMQAGRSGSHHVVFLSFSLDLAPPSCTELDLGFNYNVCTSGM